VTGHEKLVAEPWRVDGMRPPLRTNAPALGSGNGYVLRDILNWQEDQITALEAT